ncbi:MAG TPA: TylF/MycF/NovP-related O-methyltransferase [Terriglobia bacterium]|nr:TylF/MycF/NovP-related O-methyltransferase [Terriglobia bacterium]
MSARPFDGMKKSGLDSEIEQRILAHCHRYDIDPLDAVKIFPIMARRQWLKRFLAHAELFKLTLEVPGDIAELGVFRGVGLFTWANLLETYCIGDRTKTVYGFDNWRGFTRVAQEDGTRLPEIQKIEGGFSPDAFFEELKDAIKIFDSDRFIPAKARIKLIAGDIEETVAAFVSANPGVRFSLIHFDCDMYGPTKAALRHLWPLLSRRGLMLFDEYSIPDWPGETKAVDEFLAENAGVVLKTLPWNNVPAAYLIKD